MKNREPQREINTARIAEFLRAAVKNIRTEEDPFALNQYRKIFRRTVPFSLRSYFAAYLLKAMEEGKSGKLQLSGNGSGRERDKDRRSAKPEGRNLKTAARGERRFRRDGEQSDSGRREERPQEEAAHTALPEDLAATLFIGIGRKRRVFPKDLVHLILQKSGIDRDHIGEVKVLDNYSFVQILSEDAQTVISALSDTEYRGRRMTVSFSRKKGNRTDGQDDSGTFQAQEADTPAEAEPAAADGTGFTAAPEESIPVNAGNPDSAETGPDGGTAEPEGPSA